ncbi:hypothetical protein B1813_22835 [Saccharomonospora piscinae]|uniref:Uncharacterized protein n=1 Tax=Saccharomonospora piscinae TaxID=687388 RepID=A0A1V8ZW27_SACPI|nr:hypothetical protein [Saccharomonospora piscinae]OQO88991.1 hypothetical protein B1813_22835 [Saccharomonospora piscinae]
MSLTQHLHRPGPIRQWWASRSTALGPYVADLARHDTSAPPLSVAGREHAAAVGGIVGRIIETRVEPAPPYAAILGTGRRRDATLWPTHAELASTAEAAAAVEWRPTPRGWRHLVPGRDHGARSTDLRTAAGIETSDATDLIERARAAAIVTSLETAYRSGQPATPVTPEAIADAVAIIRRQQQSLQRATYLCGGELQGHAAPVFAPHWADGDVLLGPGRGGTYGLVDVKTVGDATLTNPERVRGWLWQLLSYAAADADEDLWRVRAVGVWLPRQDALVMWPLARMWEDLRAQPEELAALLRTAYEADYRAAIGAQR